MYWLSVTALGAITFFYWKGRSMHQPKEENNASAEQAEDQVSTSENIEDKQAAETTIQEVDDPAVVKTLLKKQTDPLERHLLYEKGMDLAYKQRKSDEKMAKLVISLGYAYIKEFAQLKEAAFNGLGKGPKTVIVFKQLAIALEENKEFKKAIVVCEKALSYGLEDGTKTGYEGRVKRLEKKRDAV